LSRPNLILGNGTVKATADKEATEYIFRNGESIFSVEHLHPVKKGAPHYFFIEVTDKDQKKSTWKMEPLSIPKYLESLF